jgi:hypothetical protein
MRKGYRGARFLSTGFKSGSRGLDDERAPFPEPGLARSAPLS